MTYGFCSAWCTNSIQFRNDVMFCSCVLTPDLMVQLYPHDVLSNCICHLASAFPSLATFFTMYVFFQSFKIGDRCMDITIFFFSIQYQSVAFCLVILYEIASFWISSFAYITWLFCLLILIEVLDQLQSVAGLDHSCNLIVENLT